MKRILAILLTAVLTLSVLSAVSCGISDTLLDNDEIEATDEKGNPIGGSDGDSDSGSSDSGSVLPYDKDSAAAKLAELGQTDGYEFTMKLTDQYDSITEITSGQKGGTWWQLSGENSGTAIVQRDEQTISVYSFDGESWHLDSNMVGQNILDTAALYAVSVNMYLFMANAYGDEFTRIGPDRVAGRDCTAYVYDMGTFGASLSYHACVDNALGITMKWMIEVREGGEKAGSEMEVTSFRTGSAVTVPTLPAPGEEYMDYSGALGWPDNSFTALLPKAPGTVSMSGISGNQFVCGLTGVTAADFASYVAAVQAKGFTGEQQDNYFSGETADGHTVQLMFTEEITTITLEKAGE